MNPADCEGLIAAAEIYRALLRENELQILRLRRSRKSPTGFVQDDKL